MKKKGILGIALLVLLIAGGLLAYGYNSAQAAKLVFHDNGYFLVSDGEYSEEKQIKFQNGSRYKDIPEQKISFEDIQGKQAVVNADSFAHFDNGGISAMSKSVITRLEELSDAPISNFYSIQPKAVMSNNGGVYTIDNSGLELEFKDFIWKTSDDKYILVSDSMDLHFSDDDVRPVTGFVEFQYIDEGMIRLQTSDNVWLTISDSCYAELPDGKIVSFPNKSVVVDGQEVFTLNKMVIGADDNIEILQHEQEMQNLKVPKFDITAEDGKDGIAGLQGEAGVEGLAGEIGEDGAEGAEGEEGNSGEEGSSGKRGEQGDTGETGNSGSSGSTGGTGSTGEGSKTAYPSFAIQNWQVTGTSVSCTIAATDDDDMLSEMPPATITIVNNHTGEKAFEVQGGHDFGSILNYELNTGDSLTPDTQYRLVVKATYSPDPDATSLVREFVSKTFYTDSTGVFLEYSHAKENGLYLNLKKNEYSTAEEATVYLFASRYEAETFDPNETTQTYVDKITKSISMPGEVTEELAFDEQLGLALISNKEYAARVVIKNGGGNLILSDTILFMKTLKKAATVGEPIVVKNKATYSIDMQPLQVSDPDNGITNYRYNIYYADEYKSKGDKSQLVAFVDSTSAKSVSLAVDGNKIEQGKVYVAVLVATFNDNETTVEIKTKASDEFMMDGTSMPPIMFVLKDGSVGAASTTTSSKHDTIEGNLVINKTSPILISDSQQLVVNVEAPGDYYKQFLYGRSADAYTDGTDKVEIPMTLAGLRASTQYKFTVYGYVDFNDGKGYNYVNIGSVVVSTCRTKSVKAVWSQGNPDAALSQALVLTDDNAAEKADYEMDTASIIELKLYEGSNKAKLVGSVTLTDKEAGNWTSSLKTDFYNTDTPRIITEKDFSLTSGQLTSSTYALEISAIYDYTYTKTEENLSGYKNKIPVVNDTIVISKSNAPPPLPTPGTGVAAMPITNDNAATYGGAKDVTLGDKAVVGYLLTAQYDNGAKLGRNMTFYAFENAAFENFDSTKYEDNKYAQSEIYTSTGKKDPVTAGTALFTTPKINFNNNAAASAPQVAFFFGNPSGGAQASGQKGTVYYYYTGNYNNTTKKGISRGMQLKFAYTAELSRSGTATIDTYYPQSLSTYSDYKIHIPRTAVVDLPKEAPTVMAYPWAGSAKYDVWKYLIIDHDNAITKNVAGGTRTAWLTGEKQGKPGSTYTIPSSTDLVPGLGEMTVTKFIEENYMDGNIQTNASIEFTPNTTDLSTITNDSFNEVILLVDKNTELVTQMGAPVSWYNSEIYPGNNKIDIQASSKNDGAGGIRTTMPIFRNRYSYSEFNHTAKKNGISIQLDATESTLNLNVIRLNITGIPKEMYSQLAGMQVVLKGANAKTVRVFKSLENFNIINGIANGSVTIRTSEFADLVGQQITVIPSFLVRSGAKGYYYTTNPYMTYALAQYNADGSEGNFLTTDLNDSKLIEIDVNDDKPLYGSMFFSPGPVTLGAHAKFTATNRLGNGNSYLKQGANQANVNYTGSASNDKSLLTPVWVQALSDAGYEKTFKLNSVTPSIKLNAATDIAVGLNDITFKNITLEGTSTDNIKDGKIYFTVYDTKANKFVEGTETLDGKQNYWPMSVDAKTIEFNKLDVGATYQITPWCVDRDGKLRQLIDATKSTLPMAVYTVSTSSKVNISELQVKYNAVNYKSKTVVFNFGLDQILNLDCQYEIWEADQTGAAIGDAPVLVGKDVNSVYAPLNNTYTFSVGPTDASHLALGTQYKAKVVAYSRTNPDEIVGEQEVNFWTPAYVTPMFYVNPVPTKLGDAYGINLNITVSDPVYSLTTSDAGRGGEYRVVVYEVAGSKARTAVFTTAAFVSDVKDSTIASTISVPGLKGNTSYEIALYGVTDRTGNGMIDADTPLPMLKDLSETDLNTSKSYIVKQSVLTTTLDENGVKYGEMGITSTGNKIQIQFTGAVGIESVIDKILFSVTYTKNGKTETKTDTFDPKPITPIEVEEGLYEINLPWVMTEKGKHNVTVQLKGSDDRLLKTISGTCYYR